MSTTLLTDHRQLNTSIHPPDTEDREILTIPDREGRQRLSLADRLSLHVGLWLLHRSLRAERPSAESVRNLQYVQLQMLEQHQALALLTYGLQRGMY